MVKYIISSVSSELRLERQRLICIEPVNENDGRKVRQHVWDCGKELFGEGAEAAESGVKQRLDLLYEGWTKKMLDDLSRQRKKYRRRKREAIDTLYGYISVNDEQMRYDVFRAKG